MMKLYMSKEDILTECDIREEWVDKILNLTNKMVEVLKDFGYNPKTEYYVEFYDGMDDLVGGCFHPLIKDKGICIDVVDAQWEIQRVEKDEKGEWYWKTAKYNDEEDDWVDVHQYNFIPRRYQLSDTTKQFSCLNFKECIKYLYENDYLFSPYEDEEDYVNEDNYYVSLHPDYHPTYFPRIAVSIDNNFINCLDGINHNFLSVMLLKNNRR